MTRRLALALAALGAGAALLTLLVVAVPAAAVLIASDNDNASPPPGDEDPGFLHVGTRGGGLNGLTLIYLGNGWVLTAYHVGEADFERGSETWQHVPGSGLRLYNPNETLADLMVYRIVGNPQLPDLPILEIANQTPAEGTEVVMIGHGFNRDAPTTWLQPPLREGWSWGQSGAKIRWGSNVVEDTAAYPVLPTVSFVTDFTKPGMPGFTTDEAQAVIGDSGGAVFARNAQGEWELAGVLWTTLAYTNQPAATALDGNVSYAADLAVFRDQIIALTRPECSDEIDNDADGMVDHPDDPDCTSAAADAEAPTVPALSPVGFLGLAASLIAATVPAVRSRVRRSARRAAP